MENTFDFCENTFYTEINTPVTNTEFFGREADESRTLKEKMIVGYIPFMEFQNNDPDLVQNISKDIIENGSYYTELYKNGSRRSIHVANNGISFCTSIDIGEFNYCESLYYDIYGNKIKVKQVKNPLNGENQGSTSWGNAKLYRSDPPKEKPTYAEFTEEELFECVNGLLTEISTFPNLDKYLGEKQFNFEEQKNKIRDVMNDKNRTSSSS